MRARPVAGYGCGGSEKLRNKIELCLGMEF